MTKTIISYFVFGLFTAFLLQNFLSCKHNSGVTSPDSSIPTPSNTVDITKIEDGAKTAETALKTGDPQKVLTIMTDDSKNIYTSGISLLNKSQLINLGNAISQRTLTSYNALYAEYKYTKDGITYNLALALQSDGSWKLMRL